MPKSKEARAVVLFALLCFLFSWPFFFCADGWLAPMFARQGNPGAATGAIVAGHMLGMLGPALAALLMWRFYHKESPPAWKWSKLKYYAWAVLAMLAFWTLPGLIGLVFGDRVVSPVADYIWISIAVMAALGWTYRHGRGDGLVRLPATGPGPLGRQGGRDDRLGHDPRIVALAGFWSPRSSRRSPPANGPRWSFWGRGW